MTNKNVTDSVEKVTLNRSTIEFALEYLDEEMETLYALATSLVSQIGVPDRKNPKDTDNITALRLAEIIEDRVGSTSFSNSMRTILTGSAKPPATAV